MLNICCYHSNDTHTQNKGITRYEFEYQTCYAKKKKSNHEKVYQICKIIYLCSLSACLVAASHIISNSHTCVYVVVDDNDLQTNSAHTHKDLDTRIIIGSFSDEVAPMIFCEVIK